MYIPKKLIFAVIIVLILYKMLSVNDFMHDHRRFRKPFISGSIAGRYDDWGRTALINAVRIASPDAVMNVLKTGADVDRGDFMNVTPLMYAVRKGDKEIVNILLKAGADVNAKTTEGKNALFFAFNFKPISYQSKDNLNRSEIIRILLKAGIDVNAANRWGITALMDAVSDAYLVPYNDIKAIIEAGADVNAKDTHGKTALMYSVKGVVRRPDDITLLAESGADVNAQDNEGRTALFYADNSAAIQALLDAEADDIRDNEGKTALIYAAEFSNGEIIDALINACKDVKAKDNYGKTAFDYAMDNKRLYSQTFGRLKHLSR
ncbi:MAG: ankyrin repeat domain-containing protein [Synergistaceae bacterium]|nr:ankyrin repeat domain-containing protein [Synergistaceae bacterium]